MAVGLVIVALVLGSNLLNSAIAAPAPSPELVAEGSETADDPTLELRAGVRVTPLEGWIASQPFTGVDGIRLTKGNVILDIYVIPFSGTSRQLYETFVQEEIRPAFVPPSAVFPSTPAQVGRYVGVRGLYLGTIRGYGSISGQITALSQAGGGIVFNAYRPTAVSPSRDIDLIVATLEVDSWR